MNSFENFILLNSELPHFLSFLLDESSSVPEIQTIQQHSSKLAFLSHQQTQCNGYVLVASITILTRTSRDSQMVGDQVEIEQEF